MIILCKLAEQQKSQRAIKTKNRNIKQTLHKKQAEKFSPKNKQIEKLDESTQKIGEVFEKEDSENENQQKVVPVEIEADDKNEDIEFNVRALPKSSKLTQLIGETVCSLKGVKILQE